MYVNAIRYSVLWPSARGAATATPHGTGSPACDAPSGPAPCAARADAVSREVASWIMTVLDGASHLALRSVGEIDGALSASLQALAGKPAFVLGSTSAALLRFSAIRRAYHV